MGPFDLVSTQARIYLGLENLLGQDEWDLELGFSFYFPYADLKEPTLLKVLKMLFPFLSVL